MKTTQRRKPSRAARQPRSKATVEAIFEATARVLENQGVTALTTNHVARLAGVSIGSLYEYFDNKEALLRAWCERYISEVKETADQMFAQLADVPLAEAVEPFVDALLLLNQTRPKLKRLLIEELPARLGINPVLELDRHLEQQLEQYLLSQKEALRQIDLEPMCYVVNRAGKAVLTYFFIENQPIHELPRVRAALIDLVKRAFLP
jgi:AcrR family transcriptional regulator